MKLMNPPVDSLMTRHSLLSALARREESAWDEFYRVYGPSIRQVALGRGLPEVDAHDICQIVLLEVCQQIGKLDRSREVGRGSFRSWLFHKTRWRADDWRSRRRPVLAEGDESGTGELDRMADPMVAGEDHPSDLELARQIDRKIQRQLALTIDPLQLRAFYLRRNEGWPANRVAAYLQVKSEAVDRWVHRIQKRYDRQLAQLLKDLIF